METLIQLGTISSTVLGMLGQARWAPISAAVTALFTAYAQFLDPSRKLQRYNTTTLKLRSTVLWWQSLGEVDRSNVANVNKPVETPLPPPLPYGVSC